MCARARPHSHARTRAHALARTLALASTRSLALPCQRASAERALTRSHSYDLTSNETCRLFFCSKSICSLRFFATTSSPTKQCMISFFFSVLTCPKQNVLLRTTNQSTDNEESVSLALTYIDMLVSIWLKKKGKKRSRFFCCYTVIL